MQPVTDDAPPPDVGADRASPSVAARPPVPWSWWDGLVVFLVALVLTALVAGALVAALGPGSVSAIGLLVTGPTLGLVVVGWVAACAGRPGLDTLLGWRRARAADVGMGAVHGVLAFLVGNVGLALAAAALDVQLPEVQEELADAARSSLLPLVVLAAVLLAPVVEELVFRGMLFRALADRLPVAVAALLAGLAFGLVHIEPLAIAVTAAFGVYAAVIYARRGTLVATMTMHAVFNGLGVLGLALGG